MLSRAPLLLKAYRWNLATATGHLMQWAMNSQAKSVQDRVSSARRAAKASANSGHSMWSSDGFSTSSHPSLAAIFKLGGRAAGKECLPDMLK